MCIVQYYLKEYSISGVMYYDVCVIVNYLDEKILEGITSRARK